MKGKARAVGVYGVLCLGVLGITGCKTAQYVTPGDPANLDAIREPNIREEFEKEPAASFPAHLAVIRVQGSGYESHTASGYGQGKFSVVTTRDIASDEAFNELGNFPEVAGIGTINRLLLPERLRSVEDLREAAARIHADILLLYTFDTDFRVRGHEIGPLSIITLGFAPNKEARVTTTASAAFYDVRTGFVYGVAEASDSTTQMASTWTTQQAADRARIQTEKAAFSKLVKELEKTWKGIVEERTSEALPQAEKQARRRGD